MAQLEKAVQIRSITFENLPQMDVGVSQCDPYFKILDESKQVLFDLSQEAAEYVKAHKSRSTVVFDDPKLMIQLPTLVGLFCIELWDEDFLVDDFVCFSWYQSGIAKHEASSRLEYVEIDEIDRHKLTTIPKDFAVVVQFG